MSKCIELALSKSESVTLNGAHIVSIHSEEQGRNVDVIIAIHGWSCDLMFTVANDVWWDLLPALQEAMGTRVHKGYKVYSRDA